MVGNHPDEVEESPLFCVNFPHLFGFLSRHGHTYALRSSRFCRWILGQKPRRNESLGPFGRNERSSDQSTKPQNCYVSYGGCYFTPVKPIYFIRPFIGVLTPFHPIYNCLLGPPCSHFKKKQNISLEDPIVTGCS